MAKPAKTDRQAVIDQMRKKQKSAERRRGAIIVTVCVLVALGIVAAAVVPIIKDKWDVAEATTSKALDDIGAPASSCQKITTKKADGNQQHVPSRHAGRLHDGPAGVRCALERGRARARAVHQQVLHRPRTARSSRRWSTTSSTATRSSGTTRRSPTTPTSSPRSRRSRRSSATTNLRDKFIAAPWTSSDEDGEAFPDGQHVAFTHWSAGGTGETDTTKQVGVFQYCSDVSGAALEAFMEEYPYFDSPEPSAM